MATARARIRRRQLVVVALVLCVITPVFNVLTSEASLRSAIQGFVDAVLITLLVGGYLVFVRDGRLRQRFRRLGFWTDLALSSAIVLVLFLVGRGAGQVATSLDPGRLLRSFTDAHLVYALPFFVVVVVSVQFVLQMNRLIGANVLGYFAAGVYHRPKARSASSCSSISRAPPSSPSGWGAPGTSSCCAASWTISRSRCSMRKERSTSTRGDEVVITWMMEAGLRAANCVRCFFGIRAAVARHAARYERDFGVAPRFRGGLHGGTVTAGELGDLRQQIVFVGDILNTAARLEEYAKRMDLDLVASGLLLDRLTLPPGIKAARCGDLALRGKEAPVTAYGLSAGAATQASTAISRDRRG